MSGSRRIRNELARPRRPARAGTRSATWSERFRASVLMARISSWIVRRLVGDLLLELGVAHDLGVGLEHVGDLLLLGRGDDGARLGHVREAEGERPEHDAAGHGEPERQAERAGGGVHAGGFADPFLGDRGEGEVVELGHQQAQPAAGDDERDDQVPTRSRLGARAG